MNTAQKANKSPLMQTENMSWGELIDRLINVANARNLAPSWVIDRVDDCGHPPRKIWRKIAKIFGNSQYWADWRHYPNLETPEPEPGAIQWVWELPIPEPPPPPEPIPKPILRSSRP